MYSSLVEADLNIINLCYPGVSLEFHVAGITTVVGGTL